MAYQLEAIEYPDDEPEADTLHLVAVLTEVANERHRQDETWGGPGHDDDHDVDGWFLITDRLELELDIAAQAGDHRAVRRHLVELAATRVAQIQSLDRRHPTTAAAGCQES